MKSLTGKSLILLSLIFISTACGEEEPTSGDWLIPTNQIFDGGPGKDGIPALDNPEMTGAEFASASFLDDTDLVIGYINGDDVRAYPHKILDWHEIINDEVNGHPVAITHCPLTRTSVGWEREYNGLITTFGVSGLLYQTNLMPYDRTTNSTWSQQSLKAVNGPLIGTEAKTFHMVETEWGTWKTLYPDTKVVSVNTGFSRNYQRYPYGSYRTAEGLIFAVTVTDNRLPRKERVLGVIVNEMVKAYRFEDIAAEPIIIDEFQGQSYTVVGSREKNILMAFKEKFLNGESVTFEIINDFNSPVFLKDQFDNEWDLFGNAVSGPNTGDKLEATNSFIGMAFSWASFYGMPELYQRPSGETGGE